MHNGIDNEGDNRDIFLEKNINHGIRRINNPSLNNIQNDYNSINTLNNYNKDQKDNNIDENLNSNNIIYTKELENEIFNNQNFDINKIDDVEKTDNIINFNDNYDQDYIKEKNSENKKSNKKTKVFYFGWTPRIIIFSIIFIVFMSLCISSFLKSFEYNEEHLTSYNETSDLDYRVYLKPNEFYETDYLGKNMIYVVNLIKNIDVDFIYRFQIDDVVNMDFTYDVLGKLSIMDEAGKNVFFEKEYTLLKQRKGKIENNNNFNITETISIDYDYYNSLANSFRLEYGISTTSNLTVYLRINKSLKDNKGNAKIDNSNDMSIVIPLTQKSININLNYNEINDSNYIAEESNFKFSNIINIVVSVISFVVSFIALTNLFKLILMLKVKKTNYDKFIQKTLASYDRLIVETTTSPDFDGKEIIKVSKFEELLDVRDNLKLPIMYYVIKKHEKCYFYIRHNKVIYLYIVKDVDLTK